MKFIIILALASSSVFAAKPRKWVPKYQKNSKKSEVLVKTSPSVKNKLSQTAINPLESLYLMEPKGKQFVSKLKAQTLSYKQKAVPVLTKVMKGSKYPDANRWIATYMLGKIMGVKSAPFISKFTKHPNWMLRLASLKVLLHLNQKQYKGIYARLLEDKSLIVRHQALDNIRLLKIKSLAPYVWKMLYNKKNYLGTVGKLKRSNIIKDVIKTVGELDFKQAKKPMLEMIGKKKYKDVFAELDYSLSQITNTPSPKGSLELKKHFWKRKAIKEVTI